MRTMHWVLVTGAGASTALGHPERALPMMAGWAAELRAELETRRRGLAQAAGLTEGMDAEAFEEAVGALLRWRSARPLIERFDGVGGPEPGVVPDYIRVHREQADARMALILDAINTTLLRFYNDAAIDTTAATSAYADLLDRLGSPRLTIATTNYDPSAEMAIEALGRTPDTGLTSRSGQRPVLNAEGLIARSRADDGIVGILHLHGAARWYEHHGVIKGHYLAEPFDTTLGPPVVIYPDPGKDPAHVGPVQALWRELELALADADGVLVLGHSLRDPALVAKLERLDKQVPLVVSTYGVDDDERRGELIAAPAELQRLTGLFSRACDVIALRFGPVPGDGMLGLDRWQRERPR
ncbi:MAG: SIR2 family protein [Baekduia sp.]